jgi:putative MFS transporter
MPPKAATLHHPAAFWLGCATLIAGVLAHLPMLVKAAPMHFHLAGMPMNDMMRVGMVLVPFGILLAGYGLMPRMGQLRRIRQADRSPLAFHVADSVPLSREHWKLMMVLTIALAAGCPAGEHRSRGQARPRVRDQCLDRRITGVVGADRHRGRLDRLGSAG